MRWWTRAVPAVLLAASLATLVTARSARTLPVYAARTGLLCSNCHFDPNGGGPRNEFGFNFAKNRHSLTPEDSSSHFAELSLTNRVSDTFPLYIGVNQRVMLLANTTISSDSLDRAGFYNMENALHITLQPHDKLTLVYTRDGFENGSSTKEAFGMIGLPASAYLKAGRIRTPFGMRMDDHTVATRNGFLDFFTAGAPFAYFDSVRASFLPYDPRQSDTGLEAGGQWNSLFGRVAWTNGGSFPLGFGNTYSAAKTVRLGYNNSWYMGGLSFYDDFTRAAGGFFPSGYKRATRWGYSGILHRGPAALIGEIAAGTDELPPLVGATGPKRNSLAGYAEIDWWPARQYNLRVRYDSMSLDRGNPDPYLRDLNQHTRMAFEVDWVPVPFAELRWTLRRIQHEADSFRDVFGAAVPIEDETQSYLQFHFSY